MGGHESQERGYSHMFDLNKIEGRGKAFGAFILIFLTMAVSEGAGAKMNHHTVHLPSTIQGWERTGPNRIAGSKSLFDYMNGGGELYLSYGFDHLDVYHYVSKGHEKVLVEIYFMKSTDDAFGLLSLDWGGDAVRFDPPSSKGPDPNVPEVPRALYGGGLLRVWAGRIYARIMAHRETPDTRKLVMDLGRRITGDHKSANPPELFNRLPDVIEDGWALRRDRAGYFRSHLVLNSLFFLSYTNILSLDHSVEAVTAPYEKTGEKTGRIQALVITYGSSVKAKEALQKFLEAYLPEQKRPVDFSRTSVYNIEDGHLAFRSTRQCLVLVFKAPDDRTARAAVDALTCDSNKKGDEQ